MNDMGGLPIALSPGMQIGYSSSTSRTTSAGTGQIPIDGTIPQSNEGTRLSGLDTYYTPKRLDSLLEIEVSIPSVTADAAAHCVVSLFSSGSADCIECVVNTTSAGDRMNTVLLKAVIQTSSLQRGSSGGYLFYVNFGPASAVTMYVLRSSTIDPLLGNSFASLTVREITQ